MEKNKIWGFPHLQKRSKLILGSQQSQTAVSLPPEMSLQTETASVWMTPGVGKSILQYG